MGATRPEAAARDGHEQMAQMVMATEGTDTQDRRMNR
jgi:hypothetical protein